MKDSELKAYGLAELALRLGLRTAQQDEVRTMCVSSPAQPPYLHLR